MWYYLVKTMNQDKMWEQKDKRISYQSLFSTLATLYQGGKYDYNQISDMAYELNEKLHKVYPTPDGVVSEKVEESGKDDVCPKCGARARYKDGYKNNKHWQGWFCVKDKTHVVWGPKKHDINDVDERAYGV